jgi:hypothetical protein
MQMKDGDDRPTAWDVVPDIQARPPSTLLYQNGGRVSKHHEVVANHGNESTSEGTRWLSDTVIFLGRLQTRVDSVDGPRHAM